MTPEEKRIAIALACGWKRHEATHESPVEKGGMRLPNYFAPGAVAAWTHESEPGVYAHPLNYLSDLNAMHEAIAFQAWDAEDMRRFENFLHTIVAPHYTTTHPLYVWCMMNATAPQRAGAFLLTLGHKL